MQTPHDVAAAVLADFAEHGITQATAEQLRQAVHAYTDDIGTRIEAENILMTAYLDVLPLDAETAS